MVSINILAECRRCVSIKEIDWKEQYNTYQVSDIVTTSRIIPYKMIQEENLTILQLILQQISLEWFKGGVNVQWNIIWTHSRLSHMNCSSKCILQDLLWKSASTILSSMQILLKDKHLSDGQLREIISSYPDINSMSMNIDNLSKPKVKENTGLVKKCVVLSIQPPRQY